MKKVARLRIPQQEESAGTSSAEHVSVRTTGRIKKPKAVFDPSDNYLPRSQRPSIAGSSGSPGAVSATGINSSAMERRRETPTSQMLQLQDAQHKRLSQSSNTSASTTATTVASEAGTVDVCIVCQKREAKRGAWAKNKLIGCLDCPRKVHKLCLKVDFEDMDTLRQNYKCENCRSCEVCDAFPDCDPKINQPMVTCAKCVKSYHLTCHIPNVFKYQQNFHWKCNKCQPSIGNGNILPVKTIREIIGDEPVKLNRVPQSSQQSQQSVNIAAAAAEAKSAAAKRSLQEIKNGDVPNTYVAANGSEPDDNSDVIAQKKLKHSNEDNNNSHAIHYSPYEPLDVPDVKDWSVDQVAAYFEKYFPKEAHVFKEHEIDGTSLLLLKRSDVIKKLPIKLGPSLRIYSLILKIQTQLNDPTLGWNCGL